jgi:membrane associated rhomboid family serine protease
MVAAPVGFQCPVCVGESARLVPPTRSALGARVRRHPRRATQALIALNAVAYLLTLLGGQSLLVEYGMVGGAIAAGEWWRLLTAPFLHAGLWHVGLNMMALWVLGGTLEPMLGRWRFVAVYLLSGLGGATASYLFSDPRVLSVGASGAVFGLLGAILVALRRLNRDTSGVVVLLLVNVALGFAFPGIDWRAHLGGLVVGAVVTAAFVYSPARYRSAVGWGTVAGVLLVLAWLVAWRTEQILALVGLA